MAPNNSTIAALTREYEVHSYEADYTQRASLEAVCRWFQDSAWRHAEMLGVGFAHLQAQQRFWVLSRLALEVRRFPCWGEKVSVVTWPRATKSVFAMREFELQDQSGEVLIAATSAWLAVDAQTKRPLRADRLLTSIGELPERRAVADDPEKLHAVPTLPTGAVTPVQYGDLDVNSHVNAARYVGWLLDSYPIEFFRNRRARTMQINYLDETVAGDEVCVSSEETAPGIFYHSVAKGNPNAEVCRARLEWMQD